MQCEAAEEDDEDDEESAGMFAPVNLGLMEGAASSRSPTYIS